MGEKKRMAHVSAWRASGLSKAEYCRREDLVYGTFSSWCRSFSENPGGFVLMNGSMANDASKEAIIRLANGIEIILPQGIDTRTLNILKNV